MEKTVQYLVPDGFRIYERKERSTASKAERLLLSVRRRATSVHRDNDDFSIIHHRVECPYCRRQLPSFDSMSSTVSKREIRKFVEGEFQISLFNDFDTLDMNYPFFPNDEYQCGYCHKESVPFSKNQRVEITSKKGKVILASQTMDPNGFLTLRTKGHVKAELVEFPVVEKIEYNFRNGHTSFHIDNCSGESILVVDITYGKFDFSRSNICKLLEYPFVKCKLRKAFCRVYPGEVPFKEDEFTLENTIACTKFVCFRRCFYDAIPYDHTGKIAEDFLTMAKRIHTENDIAAMLEESRLPGAKSIRKNFFLNPGLVFYIDVLELLYEIVMDVNLFTRILELETIFVILSDLRIYPHISIFLCDYKSRKGAVAMTYLVCERWREIESYSLKYAAMSIKAREKEQLGWRHAKTLLQTWSRPSIPMFHKSIEISECTINGYSFEWLKSERDFSNVGERMDNCLGTWSPYDNPVIIAKKGHYPVAAIEIDVERKMVTQALLSENNPIFYNSDFLSAFVKFKDRFGLQVSQYILHNPDYEEEF